MKLLSFLGIASRARRVGERMKVQHDNDKVAEAYRQLDNSLMALRETISEVKSLTDQREVRDRGERKDGN